MAKDWEIDFNAELCVQHTWTCWSPRTITPVGTPVFQISPSSFDLLRRQNWSLQVALWHVVFVDVVDAVWSHVDDSKHLVPTSAVCCGWLRTNNTFVTQQFRNLMPPINFSFIWTHMRYRPGYTPLYLIIRLPQSAVKYHEISRNIMWYHERLWKIVRHAMWLDAVGSITWRMGGDHHGDHNFAAMGDQAIPWVSLANLLKGFNYVMQKIGSNIDPNFLPPKLIKVVT